MGTIKLRRGTGSPAGSLAQYEVAMDVNDKILYTSTDGSDAVILADNTENFLSTNTTEIDITSDIDMNFKKITNMSGFYNVATSFATAGVFARADINNNNIQPAFEARRDLSTDGAVSGKDPRGAAMNFVIRSDVTNTNNSDQFQYCGGVAGLSGSGTNSAPHWIAGFTYDATFPFGQNTLWEGTKDEFYIYPKTAIDSSAVDLTQPILHLKTDNTGYDKAHIMCEDSNEKVFSIIGESNSFQNRDKFIVTLDPDNVNSPTNQSNFAGDYGVYYLKEYNDIENPVIEMNVFGAKDAFKLKVFDDYNGGSPNPGPIGGGGYGFKPMEIHSESLSVRAKDSDTSVRPILEVDNDQVSIDDTELLTNAESFDTVAKHRRVSLNPGHTGRTKAGHAVQHNMDDGSGNFRAPTTGAGSSTGWMVNGGFLGSLSCELDTVAVDGDNKVDSPNSKAEFKIKLYTDGANQQTGDTILTASHDAVKAGKPFENVTLSADPSNPVNGWQYYNDQTHKLRLYANGAWVDLN